MSGCGATYGTKITTSKCNSIQKGSTAKDEVMELFGKPKSILDLGLGEQALIYDDVSEKYHCPPFGPAIVKRETKRLTVTIDSKGVVKDYKIDELYSEEPIYPSGKSGSSGNTTVPYHHR